MSPVSPVILSTSDLAETAPDGESKRSIPGLIVPSFSFPSLTSIMTPTNPSPIL